MSVHLSCEEQALACQVWLDFILNRVNLHGRSIALAKGLVLTDFSTAVAIM